MVVLIVERALEVVVVPVVLAQMAAVPVQVVLLWQMVAGITVSNYGPYNGTFGAGGGGTAQTNHSPSDHGNGGSPLAGHGTNSSGTEKNASGYANGGGGVEVLGHACGSATAGIFCNENTRCCYYHSFIWKSNKWWWIQICTNDR